MFSYKYLFTYYFMLSVYCKAGFFDDLMIINAYDSDSLPTPDIIIQAGFPCETHSVTTQDGFILGIHRIPGNSTHGVDPNLPPIILQHGLLDSSADWVLSGPEAGLAFILANKGYDVWLGNSRGNVYSRAHTTLSPDDDNFWKWTWHEMGYYDVPALIDYILNKTNHTKVDYVGHSMGTTMFFVMCTMRPDYNDKILSMIALAPVAFIGNTKSPIKYLVPYSQDFEKVIDIFGHGELSLNGALKAFFKYLCIMTTFQEEVCENIMFLIVGFDKGQLDLKLLPIILGHNPAGVSARTVVHYAQEIQSKRFCPFDFGVEKNMEIYNSSQPPSYNLSLITAPVSLIYASNDYLATPSDVEYLFKTLSTQVQIFKVAYEKFNHLDFLWGRNATSLVYDLMYRLLGLKDKNPSTLNGSVDFYTLHADKIDSTQEKTEAIKEKTEAIKEKAEPITEKTEPNKVKTEPIKVKSESVKEKAALIEEKVESLIKKTEPLSKLPKVVGGKKLPKMENKEIKEKLKNIEKKLPFWQNAIIDKLVSLQKFITNRIGASKRK